MYNLSLSLYIYIYIYMYRSIDRQIDDPSCSAPYPPSLSADRLPSFSVFVCFQFLSFVLRICSCPVLFFELCVVQCSWCAMLCCATRTLSCHIPIPHQATSQ